MAWNTTYPSSTHTIRQIPEVTQDNWEAMEDVLATEHGALNTATSGTHTPGKVGVMYEGTTAAIAALSSPGSGALAHDLTLGVFVRYSNSGVWETYSTTGSRMNWAMSATGITDTVDVTHGAAPAVVLYTRKLFDDLNEYNPATGRFTAAASGYYVVAASWAAVASAAQSNSYAATGVEEQNASTTFVVSGAATKEAAIYDSADTSFIEGGYDPGLTKVWFGILTTDQIPIAGTVTSSSAGAGHDATKAIDNDSVTYWQGTSVDNEWIKIDFGAGNATIITEVRLEPYYTSGHARAKNFTLYGGQDDTAWDTLTTRLLADNGDLQKFAFDNTTAYRYYYVNIIDTYAGNCGIAEWELVGPNFEIETGSTNISVTMSGRGRFRGCLCNAVAYNDGTCKCESGFTCWDTITQCPTFNSAATHPQMTVGIILGTGSIGTGTADNITHEWGNFDNTWPTNPATYFQPWTVVRAMGLSAFNAYFSNDGIASATEVLSGDVSELYMDISWDPPLDVLGIHLYKNGAEVAHTMRPVLQHGVGTYQTVDILHYVYLNKADYLDIRATTTRNDTEIYQNDPAYGFFSVHRIGGQGI